MKVRVDFSAFSYGDAIDLEEAGFPLGSLQQHFTPRNGTGEVHVPIKLAVVLVWLFRRKLEPGLTLEAVKSEPLDSALEFEMVGENVNPKGPGRNGASPRSVSAPAGRRKK